MTPTFEEDRSRNALKLLHRKNRLQTVCCVEYRKREAASRKLNPSCQATPSISRSHCDTTRLECQKRYTVGNTLRHRQQYSKAYKMRCRRLIAMGSKGPKLSRSTDVVNVDHFDSRPATRDSTLQDPRMRSAVLLCSNAAWSTTPSHPGAHDDSARQLFLGFFSGVLALMRPNSSAVFGYSA
ncbi:hypothetical protein CONPUDRAFT_154814 [Coniophora puteana RWD-64-598 SS2]|uniref:Uncharacterized protein n=1 Tax=Coniophora puteana (strain RWD-64-598) TaxID=741705 RepID=A0A5M3MQN6_CONPW|nr:uncharacterized protein CONPUDRAFT_154814 [Coniophora puteana RWD-64-598 SS2]EIW80821.1 hypothetical protein CONPUDRAFT_154814 [Coniophora puteana RWD-64-598 SS2]